MPPRWPIALFGLFLATFALLALSGPGRIDIIDGQARYEVARSLLEHGDTVVRDPNVWFSVFPGPDGKQYSYYRFPHSVLGLPALWIVDRFGSPSEPRRQFSFVLVSAAAGAVLAVVYAQLFRDRGMSAVAACGWAFAGIVCTPSWYYSTSTYDEILGSTTLVALVLAASRTRTRDSGMWLATATLLIAFAINCKQPLGGFVLLAIALADDPTQLRGARFVRAGILLSGVALGGGLLVGYSWLRFPPGSTPDHTHLLEQYAPNFPGEPLAALIALIASPGAGVLWYSPAIVLSFAGFRAHWQRSPRAMSAGVLASAAYLGLIVAMTIFKGDVAWGPRYLTPLLAIGWLLAPAGAARLPRFATSFLLAIAFVVQLLSLSVDPHRLYLEHRLPGAVIPPRFYYDPSLAHLLQRPREVWGSIHSDGRIATEFTPSWLPTAAPPVLERIPLDDRGPRRYAIFDSLRPWWSSFRRLPAGERPVDPDQLLLVFGGMLAFGAALTYCGLRPHRSFPS